MGYSRALIVRGLENRSQLNGRNNLDDDNGRLVEYPGQPLGQSKMYEKLCSYENLLSAYEKAKKGKSNKLYVLKFKKDLENNLKQLQSELINQTYKPALLRCRVLD